MYDNTVNATFYMHDKVLIGTVSLPHGKRLSDFLNGVNVAPNAHASRFIKLTNVTVCHKNGIKENVETAHVNKSTIEIVATLDGDLARGIGAQKSSKRYPFIPKTKVRASMTMPDFDVAGYLHCTKGQTLCDVIEDKIEFLPITDAQIRGTQIDVSRSAVFCAVNKEQIGSLYCE